MPGARKTRRFSSNSEYIQRNKPRQAKFFNNFLDLQAVTKPRWEQSGQLSASMTD
jgi:hypothetical protein